ncbi:hypothetical protein CR513_21200, partial [Mucuna pruriens]
MLSKEFDSLQKENDSLKKKMKNNLYKINLTNLINKSVTCLVSINKALTCKLETHLKAEKKTCKRSSKYLFTRHIFYVMHVRNGNKLEDNLSPKTLPLKLLQIDLFRSTKTTFMNGKCYGLEVDKTFKVFSILCKCVQNIKGINIVSIRSDHRKNLKMKTFKSLNGVLERKNRFLLKMAITMLNDNNSPKYFWVEVNNTSRYFQKKICTKPILKKTPYELWMDKQPNISYLYPFFGPKSDKRTFLGYFDVSKAYKVYNSRTLTVEESIHVRFNDSKTLYVIPTNMFMHASSSSLISLPTCMKDLLK